jgi:hypothetical protein
MYHVRWEKRALAALTNLWLQADSAGRKAITAATHALDTRLRRDPHNEGESRSDGRRIAFEPPLAIVFRVEAYGLTVSVLEAGLIRRRK